MNIRDELQKFVPDNPQGMEAKDRVLAALAAAEELARVVDAILSDDETVSALYPDTRKAAREAYKAYRSNGENK